MKPGCYIDGSQMSSLDFTIAVIDFAVSLGFEIDHQAYRNDLEHLPVADDDERLSIIDSLEWTRIGAEEYLNDEVAPSGYWFVTEESSLFLEQDDEWYTEYLRFCPDCEKETTFTLPDWANIMQCEICGYLKEEEADA